MGYFTNVHSPEYIKAVYRSLCMKHHPDRGGSTSIMQDINVAYQAALAGLAASYGYQSFDLDEHKQVNKG